MGNLRVIDGEASTGIGRALRWMERRTFTEADVPPLDELVDHKRLTGTTISVVLPALNEAWTLGDICRAISGELLGTLVDRLIVIDGGSRDGSQRAAAKGGAEVIAAAEILPELPAVPGKGESLWRSLAVTDSDIVVWIDADIRNFDERFVTRLVAPLIADPALAFVKAYYRRPITAEGSLHPTGGGRVTELLARPMLNALFPELAGFIQPLSGEYAGRRSALERIPFFTGYGVEVGLLIDLLDACGLDAMAQVDLEERVHRNRPLQQLGAMAHTIAQAILRRAEDWGRIATALDCAGEQALLPGDDGGLELRAMSDTQRPPMAMAAPLLQRRGRRDGGRVSHVP